jgi:RNA recognition motif-containing protein
MNKIYVGNLPFQLSEQDLDASFQQFGKIKEISIIKDRDTNECKGFAFITFDSAESANGALALDGTDFQGRPMKVSMAIAKTDDRRGGGGSGGGYRKSSGGGFGGNRGGGFGGGGGFGRGGRSGGGRTGGGRGDGGRSGGGGRGR